MGPHQLTAPPAGSEKPRPGDDRWSRNRKFEGRGEGALRLNFKPLSSVALTVFLTLTGCHRESPPAAPASQKSQAAVSIDATAGNNIPTPPSPAAAPTDPPVDEPSGEISLEKLNLALKQYIVISPVVPDDLAELYRAKLIPKVPIPPPGKRYLIDKKKAQVTLVNQ